VHHGDEAASSAGVTPVRSWLVHAPQRMND
jgi:hypothetical protein